MDIIEKIIDCVYELQSKNCKNEDLIIAYSPLIERFIIEEAQHNIPTPIHKFDKLMGIKTYGLHPYNEIVVYDSKNVSYYPELIKKVEVNISAKTEGEKTLISFE